ncbi:MAG: hypothetical protein ACR2I5_11675 [Candidatus Limnocylindria bacterium]
MITERNTGWATTARDLYLVAMAVFLVTIVIGILNGADAVEFDRNQILTHVHSGTIGWLTLAIVASAFLVFRAASRPLMIALAVSVPVYVAAFYTGNLPFRAISGVVLLAIIGWLIVWAWRTYLTSDRTLPQLAVTLGLTAFGYGALFGVLIQLALATGTTILPGDTVGAHASAMTFGYLVLAAMGLIEWRLLDTRGLPMSGLIQIGSLFIGGLIISVSLLAGAEQIGGMLYLLAELIAVVLFVIRVVVPAVRGTRWLEADARRHSAVASIWAVVALLLFMYVVYTFISSPDGALPFPILIASDHSVYIGVITNVVLGLLMALVLGRASGWLPHLMFWGVNLGLAIFVVGLITEVAEIKRIGAPLMGSALLIALGWLASRAIGSGVAPDDSMGTAPASS